MNLREAKELLEENGYILEEGIFDSIKNKFFKKKEDTIEVKPVNKTELDSIALKLFKGISREEWEEGAHQNESVNKAFKLLESAGYIIEDTEEENSEAVKILANLHYQIYNGGWEQACYNGYVDELNNYGVTKWEKDLETEFAKSPLLKKVKKVIELIKLAMEQTVMVRNCPDCNGEGSWEETEEDEDGYEESHIEYCDKCDGDGVVGVKTYDRVDFGSGTANDWADNWDSNYYEQVDSKLILILLMI